jgi:hypothetical protein
MPPPPLGCIRGGGGHRPTMAGRWRPVIPAGRLTAGHCFGYKCSAIQAADLGKGAAGAPCLARL